jgi:hypothetical protein
MKTTFTLSDVIAGPIERIAKPSAEEFLRYSSHEHARPFVVPGALAGKRFPSQWTEESWRASIGHLVMNVWVSATGTFRGGTPPYDATQLVSVKMPVNEFFDRLNGSPAKPILAPNEKYYLFQVPIAQLEAIMGDYERPSFLPDVAEVRPHAWVSGPGVSTQPHYDLAENLFVQVRGRKRVLLWDPSQYSLLHTIPLHESYGTESRIDMNAPDIEKYPEFARSRAVECTLEAGDLLYIPLGWFHYVTTLEHSFSLNHWWVPPYFHGLLQAAGMLIAESRTLRPELRQMVSQILVA